MPVNMTVNLKPTIAQLRKDIKRKMGAVTDFKPLTKKVSIKFEQWVLRNFRSSGKKLADPPWAPLKAGGRWKGKGKNRVFDPSAKVMQDTGHLMQSFFPSHSDNKKASIGSNLPYASPHHEGEGHLPKRQLIPEPNQVERDILLIAQSHVNKALKK